MARPQNKHTPNRLLTDAVREIKNTKSRFISLMVLSALAVCFLAGLRATAPDMKLSADRYFDGQQLMDLRVLSTLGLTEEDLAALAAAPGVETAQGAYLVDAILPLAENDYIVKVHSLTDGVDLPRLREGRMPEKADELLVEPLFVRETGVQLGDRVTLDTGTGDFEDALKFREFTVVGVADSPLYINVERGSSSLGTGKVAAFVLVPPEAFDMEVYTEAYLRMEDTAALETYSKQYEDVMKAHVDALEPLADARAQLRLDSVLGEANEKLDEAQQELDQAKADAEKELSDAKRDLDQARRDLDEGWREYRDGQQELADAEVELAEAKADLEQAAIDLADGEKELAEGWQEYYENKEKYDDGYLEYQEGLSEYNKHYADYVQGKKDYEEGYEKLRSARSSVDRAQDQITDGKAQLEASQAQLMGQLDEMGAMVPSELGGPIPGTQVLAVLQEEAALPPADQVLTPIVNAAAQSPVDGVPMSSYILGAVAQMDQQEVQLQQNQSQLNSSESDLNIARRELNKAKRELNKAKAELKEAKIELMQAEYELTDAKAQLEEGYTDLKQAEKDLAEGKQEYADGLIEYEDGVKDLAQAKIDLADALVELRDGEREYADGLVEYEDGKAEAEEKIADAEEELAKARRDVAEIEECEWYLLDRNTNMGYLSYSMDADRMGNLASVFPLIFFLVAALVCLTTMTRMVEEQRIAIGGLKALGYTRGAIAIKYVGYGFLASTIGAILGLVVGLTLLPWIICTAWAIMYTTGEIVYSPEPLTSLLACGAAIGTVTLSAWFACASELRAVPAQLMRPKAPPMGKRILLERITPLWRRLSFNYKVTLRNLFRYQRRFWMTVIGIGGCAALIVTAFGLRDSLFDVMDRQYDELNHFSATVGLVDKATPGERKEVEQALAGQELVRGFQSCHSESVTAESPAYTLDASLRVVPDSDTLGRFVELRHRTDEEEVVLPDDGVLLTEKMAILLDLEPGDTFVVDGDRRVELTVADTIENYIQHYIYMSETYYEQVFGEPAQVNLVLVDYDTQAPGAEALAAQLVALDGVTSLNLISDTRRTFTASLESVDYAVVLIIVCAAALAFVVLYNLTNINITERMRELATLKVLGFYDGELSAYVYRENVILTFFGVALGMVLGKLLHQWLILTVEIDMLMFGRTLQAASYGYAAVLTVIFSLTVNLLAHWKLKKLDMVESLKTVE